MNWLSIFNSGIDGVIDSIGNALDKLVTSDEERLKLRNELSRISLQAKLEAENQALKHEAEITKRWQSDNEHAITRLVRPAVVIWSFAILTVVMFMDGNISDFKINEAYIPMLQTIIVTVVVAYFGSRGLEKTTKVFKGSNNDKV